MRRLLSALAGLVLLAGCTLPEYETGPGVVTSDLPVPTGAVPAVVERVVDGDTLVADVRGERERVRLLRIDTPELSREGQPAECLAEAATAALEELVPPGTPVLLATDVEVRDRFDRLLAHVWVDGTWVNGAMLRAGWADQLTIPPNVAHDEEVRAAVAAARAEEVGLWDPAAC